MAELDEIQARQTAENIRSLDDALSNISERQEDATIAAEQESRSQSFFTRFLNFITGRSRRRPGPITSTPGVATGATVNALQGVTSNEEIAQREQGVQQVDNAVDPAVRDELIRNKSEYLNRRFIEFVDAQPIVKVLVSRNMMSLSLCRNRFSRYLNEMAEKAVDIDLRHGIDALEGQALEAAQGARLRERISIIGAETEDAAINSLLYDNNGDGFLPLVFPQGFTTGVVERRLNNNRLRPDMPEARAFIENFSKSDLFIDNYTSERDDVNLAVKVGTVLISRISFRQDEMINDVMDSIAGLEGGELLRTMDRILENYNLDMLGKAVLILPNVLSSYIELARIPLPPVEQINETLEEIDEMNRVREENEAMGADPYDYKDSRQITGVPGRLAALEVEEMLDAVVGRAELVNEFVVLFRRSAGIEGFSIDKRAPLAVVSDLAPFIYEAGAYSVSNDIIKNCYINVMQTNSRRESEAYISLMFEQISDKLPRAMQKVAFRNAQIS